MKRIYRILGSTLMTIWKNVNTAYMGPVINLDFIVYFCLCCISCNVIMLLMFDLQVSHVMEVL
jgi:hypothetical protein